MKERDFYLDNAKFILIFLVVLGHYCGNYLNSHILLGLYDSIYSFHMPAFIIIAGFLSKSVKQQRYRDIDTLLLPYIIIQTIFILYRKLLGIPQGWSYVYPIDANWFLIGLFLWRLMIPYFNYIKFPIATAIIISLVIGNFNDFGRYLDLERIMVFFVYFVIGYFLPVNYKEFLFKYGNRIKPFFVMILIIATFFAIAYFMPGKASFLRRCFIPDLSYDAKLGRYADLGMFIRLATYFVSLLITFIFFAMIPNRKTWYSEMGTRTINVFLFHLIFIYLIGQFIPYKAYFSELLAIPAAFIITLFLSGSLLGSFLEKLLNVHNIIFQLFLKGLNSVRIK
jgi:fucose 4-O-acetylase-like acetyltransferase